MNRHHKTPLIAISLAAAMLVAFSCSRHFRQPKPKSWADSLISATLKTDSDDRVLALIDSLEAEGDVSPVVANFRRGYAYERKGQRYHAERYWKKAVEESHVSEDDLESYFHAATFLANRLKSKNDNEGAVRTATTALAKMEHYADARPLFKAMLLQTLGGCQSELRLYDEAETSYQAAYPYFLQAIANDSTDYSLRNAIIGLQNIAKANMTAKRFTEAKMWAERCDSLLGVLSSRPDAKPEKVDKMLAMTAFVKARIAQRMKKKEEAAKAYATYEATAYAKTKEGRLKSTTYLLKAGRYDEAADCFADLDAQVTKKNGGMTLENIKGKYADKFKANYKAGRLDTALTVANLVLTSLDSAIANFQNNETAELATIYEMQQKEAEIARQQAELSRQYLIELGIVLVLLTTFFIVYAVVRQRMHKQLEEKNRQLLVANARAEESSKMKTNFIQQISHEIRTPLNILSGFTQIVTTPGMELDSDTRASINQQITENTDRITGLVNKMLELSEASIHTVIERSDRAAAALIASQAVSASGIDAARHLHFVLNMTEEAGACELTTNQTAAVRVLTLLLDNARKFTAPPNNSANNQATPAGGQTASLTVEARQQEMLFVVEDSGPGIPAAESERIFEEFVQLDEYYEGTGIGLSVARSLARRLGGEVTLDTGYTSGARFTLSLPL